MPDHLRSRASNYGALLGWSIGLCVEAGRGSVVWQLSSSEYTMVHVLLMAGSASPTARQLEYTVGLSALEAPGRLCPTNSG